MPRRRSAAAEARRRKNKEWRKREREASMREAWQLSTKNRVLLPRPEVKPLLQPLTQVVVSSTSNGNVSPVSIDPEAAPVKKIYFIGPDSVLYEAVVPTTPIQSAILPIQSTVPQIQSPVSIVPSCVPVNPITANLRQKLGIIQPGLSATPFQNPDLNPVEEIQVKVELPDYASDDEIPGSENSGEEEIITAVRLPKLECESDGEETESADESKIIRKIESNDGYCSGEEHKNLEDITIKKEEIESDQEEIDNTHIDDSSYNSSNSVVNKKENISRTVSRYPRRVPPTKKPSTSEDDWLQCDECFCDYDGNCSQHGQLNIIEDTRVPADINDKLRAKKTAPSQVTVADTGIDGVESGVWSRDFIPARTRFGPFEGKVVYTEVSNRYTWMIQLEGDSSYYLDASEPGLSNWMRYVGSARRAGQQNMRAYQHFGKLFFRTIRPIVPFEELLLDDETIDKLERDQELSDTETEQQGSSIEALADTIDIPRPLFVGTETTIKTETDSEQDQCPDSKQKQPETSAVDVPPPCNKSNTAYAEESLFACTMCNARFRYEETLNNHLRTHIEKKQLVCEVCSERFFDKATLEKHKEIHKSCFPEVTSVQTVSPNVSSDKKKGNRFACSMCNTHFVYEDSLQHHMRTHTVENLLQCELCKEQFFDYRTLRKHLQVHEDTMRACPVCKKQFRLQASLNKHLAKHGDNPFACALCDQRFREEHLLEYHQKSEHPESKNYVCNVCSKRFVNGVVFKEHLARHRKENIFACAICNERFTNVRCLNGHLRVHNGLKTLECPHCDKKYSRHCALRKHIKTHNKYACLECDKRFASPNDLLVHRKIHTGDTPYKCSLCDAAYSRKDYLTRHYDTHTAKQALECNVCHEQFTAARFLRSHIRARHHETMGLQTWKSWEAWKSQGNQNQRDVPVDAPADVIADVTADVIADVTADVTAHVESRDCS